MNKLDSFEESLLHELRTVVDQNRLQPHRPRRATLRLGSVGAAAALAVGGFAIFGGGSTPAFAVTESANGDVTVTVHKLDDAGGLQQELADHGVPSTVRYTGEDLSGDSDAALRAAFDPRSLPQGTRRYDAADCNSGDLAKIAYADGEFSVTIPASVVASGENLTVLTAGSDITDADLLVAIGNSASGCATMITDGGSAIGASFAWYPPGTDS
jgi:hypothetical protein